MAFVNERVSEEDIQRYGLDELVGAANKDRWKKGRPIVFIHTWTIDRERDAFFVRIVRKMTSDTISGIAMPTGEEVCALILKGHQHRFLITRMPESSKDQSEVPYKLVWKISALDNANDSESTKSQAGKLVREALAVRCEHGPFSQVPNTVTSFIE